MRWRRLEHFPGKWEPVRRRKCDHRRTNRANFDSIGTEFARVGDVMRALILYAVLVIIGTVVAVFVGLFVEREITDAGSVAVFIVLFFANFYASWVITRTVVERMMKTTDEATPPA